MVIDNRPKSKDTCQLEWTHRSVSITDIRLLNNLYAFCISPAEFSNVLFVNIDIFESRLTSYFLGKPYTREMILNLKWNMYVTKGYFVKIDSDGNLQSYKKPNEEKYFVSFLDVAGELGEFVNYKIK